MLQSIDRAMQVLDILKNHRTGLGVTELAHRLNVAKSTIHRILSSLEAHDYVRQEGGNGNYRLGLKFLEMQQALIQQMEISAIARPTLEQLSVEAQEIVHLVEQQDFEVVYLDKVEQYANTIRIYSQVGRRAPMHCTGVGKVMLAFADEPMVVRYFNTKKDRRAFTEHTLVSETEIREHFTRIRELGYSMDNEEHERGIRCVAAPVFNHLGEVAYGISVTGPLDRMDDERLEKKINLLIDAAMKISSDLGYREA